MIYSNLNIVRVMCDLDFQGKGQRSRSRDRQVTLQVTFPISGSMPGGTMPFFCF